MNQASSVRPRLPRAVLLWLVVAAVALVSTAADSPATLSLSLRDQYGANVVVPAVNAEEPVVTVVAFSDREGAEGNRRWAKRLVERYRPHLEGRAVPHLRIVPVAHLREVPFFVRSFVRRGFRGEDDETGEPILPIALDWKGEAARQLGFTPGVPNMVVLDAAGRVRARTAARADEDAAGTVFAALDELLARPTRRASR